MIDLAVLAATYKKFRLTSLAYTLILVHCIILMIGGHYTYAKVPFFEWLKDYFLLEHNNHDKIGHFAQGVIPAIITRKLAIRKHAVNGSRWLAFFVVSFCPALSACYELIEWWVALATNGRTTKL